MSTADDRVALAVSEKGVHGPAYRDPIAIETRYDASRTLFICHREWHGIRSASLQLPGHHAMISAYETFDADTIVEMIRALSISTVVLQGYSENFSTLAGIVGNNLSHDAVRCCAIVHVSASQFTNNTFETQMLTRIQSDLQEGHLAGAFSVKPGFTAVAPFISDWLVVNGYPLAPDHVLNADRLSAALVPSQNEWRKNPYPNHLAMIASDVKTVFSTLPPGCIDPLFQQRRLHYLGFVETSVLRQMMTKCRLVSYVTLLECQPMIALEAASTGTPCLTGPLYLPFLDDDPLRRLTEVRCPDDVTMITRRANEVLEIPRSEMSELCRTYMQNVNGACIESYDGVVSRVWAS